MNRHGGEFVAARRLPASLAGARALADLLPILCSRSIGATVAFDGRQAARRATVAPRPHVVVMDLEMPVMDGFQAASAI
jgi:CheY-like chemotaxis protein